MAWAWALARALEEAVKASSLVITTTTMTTSANVAGNAAGLDFGAAALGEPRLQTRALVRHM